MNEVEYIATREQREPILRDILRGYVPRRIEALRERLPLEIFASSLEESPSTEGRDMLVRALNRVEDSLLVGGCQPRDVFLQGYHDVRSFGFGLFDLRQFNPKWIHEEYKTDPSRPRVVREFPEYWAEKAFELYMKNPLKLPQHNPNVPDDGRIDRLRDCEALAHPDIFKGFFYLNRDFLDAMHIHLLKYVSE
ncbi:MAG: hypothetical protein WC595_05445 [Candidatus Nanoarchaeia archaeon]